jgi:hypothetical protein
MITPTHVIVYIVLLVIALLFMMGAHSSNWTPRS